MRSRPACMLSPNKCCPWCRSPSLLPSTPPVLTLSLLSRAPSPLGSFLPHLLLLPHFESRAPQYHMIIVDWVISQETPCSLRASCPSSWLPSQDLAPQQVFHTSVKQYDASDGLWVDGISSAIQNIYILNHISL